MQRKANFTRMLPIIQIYENNDCDESRLQRLFHRLSVCFVLRWALRQNFTGMKVFALKTPRYDDSFSHFEVVRLSTLEYHFHFLIVVVFHVEYKLTLCRIKG